MSWGCSQVRKSRKILHNFSSNRIHSFQTKSICFFLSPYHLILHYLVICMKCELPQHKPKSKNPLSELTPHSISSIHLDHLKVSPFLSAIALILCNVLTFLDLCSLVCLPCSNQLCPVVQSSFGNLFPRRVNRYEGRHLLSEVFSLLDQPFLPSTCEEFLMLYQLNITPIDSVLVSIIVSNFIFFRQLPITF